MTAATGRPGPSPVLGAWARPRVGLRQGGSAFWADVPIEGEGPYLSDHFPEERVFPGVLLLETAFRAARSAVPAAAARLVAVDSLRLLRPLVPGDVAHVEGHFEETGGRCGRWTAAVLVTRGDDRPVARMRFTLADGPGEEVQDLQDVQAPEPAASAAGPAPVAAGAGAMGPDGIARVLPHGPGMLFVQRVEELVPGHRILAVSEIHGDEPCFAGAPAGAGYPESLLLEAFGQSAALLWLGAGERERRPGEVLMFVSARGCTFGRPARPGDVVRLDVRLEHAGAGAAFVSGAAWAGPHRIAGFDWLGAVVRPSTELALTAPRAGRPEAIPSERSAVHG